MVGTRRRRACHKKTLSLPSFRRSAVSFPPPPSTNPTHALATAIMNYNPEWARIALEQGADVFAKSQRGETLLADALIFGLRASKRREKSVSGRMFANGQIKTAALLLEHSRT